MNKQELTSFLCENNYLLVDKMAFMNYMVEVNMQTKVDKRLLYISRKKAAQKYNLNRYWFEKSEADRFSVLVIMKAQHSNSVKKYSEQSILDELKRQSY